MSMSREELTAIVHAAVDEALTGALETYVQAALAAQREKLASAAVPLLRSEREKFFEDNTKTWGERDPDERAALEAYNAAIALLEGREI